MKLNPNSYRRTLDAMRPSMELHRCEERKLTELAVSSHVPLAAVLKYARDFVPGGEGLDSVLAGLVKFYGYTEIKEWA
jgi:hypothetical protein